MFQIQIKTLYTSLDIGFSCIAIHQKHECFAVIKKFYIGKVFRRLGNDMKAMRDILVFLFGNY